MSDKNRVAVIGAGVTGVTTAYKLARLGANVTVFEANRHASMETSYANGGQLSASNAEVWNNVSTLAKGVNWMFSSGAPLLMNLSPSWHKYSWLAEFIAAVPHYEANTLQTVQWAIAARDHLTSMAEAEDIEFNREETGILHFYETEKEFAVAKKVTALLKKGGLDRKEVGPDDIRDIEPALRGKIQGGFFTESDFTGDINKFTKALAAASVRRGVTFHYETPVEKLVPHERTVSVCHQLKDVENASGSGQLKEEFDQVVICAGIQSRRLATMVNDRVNIYPVKGYSITVNLETPADQAAAPKTSLLDDNAKIVTSRLGDDRFRVAGTAEINGANKDIVWKRIAPMINWCHTRFPEMSTENVSSWAGLRPMMPNMLPRVGKGRHPGVYFNTGHGHLGWTLSGATAEIVSQAIIEDQGLS